MRMRGDGQYLCLFPCFGCCATADQPVCPPDRFVYNWRLWWLKYYVHKSDWNSIGKQTNSLLNKPCKTQRIAQKETATQAAVKWQRCRLHRLNIDEKQILIQAQHSSDITASNACIRTSVDSQSVWTANAISRVPNEICMRLSFFVSNAQFLSTLLFAPDDLCRQLNRIWKRRYQKVHCRPISFECFKLTRTSSRKWNLSAMKGDRKGQKAVQFNIWVDLPAMRTDTGYDVEIIISLADDWWWSFFASFMRPRCYQSKIQLDELRWKKNVLARPPNLVLWSAADENTAQSIQWSVREWNVIKMKFGASKWAWILLMRCYQIVKFKLLRMESNALATNSNLYLLAAIAEVQPWKSFISFEPHNG